jgi:hypothetical protein
MNNSSNSRAAQTLARISLSRAQAFFEDLANLRDGDDALARFELKFAAVLPAKMKRRSPQELREMPPDLRALIDPRYEFSEVFVLRQAVRTIWQAPDRRTKEWRIFRLVEETVLGDTYPSGGEFGVLGKIAPLPPPSLFEQACDHLRDHCHRLTQCNNPACPSPFFFARRLSQRFCSEDCALPAQREIKRRWWTEHGTNWRRRRAAKKKKPRRARGSYGL